MVKSTPSGVLFAFNYSDSDGFEELDVYVGLCSDCWING